MLGWFRAEAACASRWKRARACAIFRDIVRQEFQRDETMEADVLGFVHHAHASAAEAFQDAIVRDGLVEQRIVAGHVQDILGCGKRQVNARRGVGVRVLAQHTREPLMQPRCSASRGPCTENAPATEKVAQLSAGAGVTLSEARRAPSHGGSELTKDDQLTIPSPKFDCKLQKNRSCP